MVRASTCWSAGQQAPLPTNLIIIPRHEIAHPDHHAIRVPLNKTNICSYKSSEVVIIGIKQKKEQNQEEESKKKFQATMVMASSSLSRPFSIPPAEIAAACHARSSSLPCGSHPILSQLKDQMHKLEGALAASIGETTAINLVAGLRTLKTLYDMVDGFLQLPQAQEATHHHENWANLLLEDLLKFLEAFGAMAATLSSLKERNLTTLISLRRREPNGVEPSLQSFINDRKKSSKEMGKLVAVLKTMAKPSAPLLWTTDDVETVAVFNGVKALTVSAAVSVASALMCSTPRKVVERLMAMPRRQVQEAMKEMNEADCAMDCALRACTRGHANDELLRMAVERMVVLEDCLNDLERENESIFRSLISTRVSILNILTQ